MYKSIDLTKSFNYISHNLLLDKPRSYGFRKHDFELIITDRKQYVSINGHK